MEVVVGLRSSLGEGPRWDAVRNSLIWVDIEGRALHRWDGSSIESRRFDERVGCANPTESGDVAVALAGRVVLAGSGETLARFPHGADVRANDGACDPLGRLWVGTTALDQRPGAAALYRLDGGSLVPKLTGLTLANGLGWSPAGDRMWLVDSKAFRIDEFVFDGELGRRRPFASFARGTVLPDGLAVDDEGGVWVAMWGGSELRRFTPDGVLDRVLRVPAEYVTSCCFGGADGRTLFITTAAPDGRVYGIEVDVSGPPAHALRSTAPSQAGPTSAR